MKQVVKYTALLISKKLKLELRVAIEEKTGLWKSTYNGDSHTSLNYWPSISLTIIRPTELDENGKRKTNWDPNDILAMTKETYPIFLEHLKAMHESMKIPELYSYVGKRLELDAETADKVRRVFKIGMTTLELSAVIIVQPDEETRVEGVKIKFNNENSSTSLTLNEFYSLMFNLEKIDVDSLCMMMFNEYITKNDKPTSFTPSSFGPPTVDILPKG